VALGGISKDDRLMKPRPLAVLCLLGLGGLIALPSARSHDDSGERPVVRPEVLRKVEVELDRLAAEADRDGGPVHPRPSEEVAYLLLSGLASRGRPLELGDADQEALGLQSVRSPSLVRVAEDVRVAICDVPVQDRSGSYTLRRAHYYVREGDRWVRRYSGTTVVAE
jgi:hypothetical protein